MSIDWKGFASIEMGLPSHFDGINREYTPDEIKKAEDAIWIARNHFLLKAPFFGVLAMGLDLVDSSKWLKTVSTDGKAFYYNVGFLNMLTPIGVQFCFAHVILHCAYDHFKRSDVPLSTLENLFPEEDLCHEDKIKLYKHLYSMAADYAANRDVANVIYQVHKQHNGAKIKRPTDAMISPEILNILYDEKYEDFATEDILIDLFRQAKAGKNPFANGFSLDDHTLMSNGYGGNNPNGRPNDNGDIDESYFNGKPRLTDEERNRLMNDFQSEMFKAYDMHEQSIASGQRNAGTVPGDIERYIGKLKNPEINWRQYINSRILSKFCANEETWNNLDRRSFDDDFFMSGKKDQEKVQVVIFIDTSGSISDQMVADFLSEIKGITSQYDDYELTIWCFDGIVRRESIKVFTPDNIHSLDNYQMFGGGGTMFLSNWAYMEEISMKPKLIIMFTDGLCNDDYGIPNYAETIYVVNSEVVVPPEFGTTVRYRHKIDPNFN